MLAVLLMCNQMWNNTNLGTGSIAMVPRTASASLCCDACRAVAACEAWTLNPADGKCFLKDNIAANHTQAGRISGTSAPAPPSPPPPPSPPRTVHATVRAAEGAPLPLATFGAEFLGVNADWWLDECGGEGAHWAPNASIARLDLENARLNTLAAGLGGGTLRVGGTHCDDVVYDVRGFNATALGCPKAAGQTCYPICLTEARFEAIAAFAARARLRLAFGLNLKLEAPVALAQAVALMEFAAARNLSVDAWELGNEIGTAPTLDLGPALAQARDRIWGPAGSAGPHPAGPHPALVGPDVAGDGADPAEPDFVPLVARAPFLRALTFHAYAIHHGGPKDDGALVRDMLDLDVLDNGIAVYANMVRAVATAPTSGGGGYRPEVWMGEGEAAGYGGREGVTNTFANSFWYLNAMGAAASLGVRRFLRQAFVGGGYEMVDRVTFLPNPDYWAALLWRRAVGTAALAVDVAPSAAGGGGRNASSILRAYAFCASSASPSMPSAAGDVALLAINFDAADSLALTLETNATSRRAWIIRAAGNLTSRTVELQASPSSWRALELTDAGSLPPMLPLEQDVHAPLLLPPHSYAVAILAGVRAPACMAAPS